VWAQLDERVLELVEDVRPAAQPDLGEICQPLAGQPRRGNRVVHRLAVARQQHVGLVRQQLSQRRDGEDGAFHTDVRPLQGGRRPHRARPVDQVARESKAPAAEVHEVRDAARGVSGGRDRRDVEMADAPGAVLRHRAGDLDRLQQSEAVLSQVVVVRQGTALPVLVDVGDQVPLDRRHPDPRAGRRQGGQPLHLVAVMVGHDHVGDTVHPQLAEVVQPAARSGVDGDRRPGAGVDEQVHRAGVVDRMDVRPDRLSPNCHIQQPNQDFLADGKCLATIPRLGRIRARSATARVRVSRVGTRAPFFAKRGQRGGVE